MDKIKEFFDLIKTLDKIDDLKKEKAENEKIINDINEENESLSAIGKELEILNNKMHNFKFIKKWKPIYFSIVFVGIVALITLLLSEHAIYYKIGDVIAILICLGVPFTLLGKFIFGGYSKGIEYNSLEEIQKEIEEKEKQKELLKSKSETNKEILVEKEKRQVEIDKERHNCVSKIYQYVYEVKKSLNSNNSDFSQTMDSQMLENEELAEEEKGSSYQKRNNH